MKKLSLKLDTLKVESFNTVPEGHGPKGTVHGHDDTEESVCYCPSESCPSASPYQNTCAGTCTEPTCGAQVCIPLAGDTWNTTV